MNLDEQIRPIRVGPGAAVGIDEVMIQEVVHAFYARIRTDPLLGPLFKRVIVGDWSIHLAHMCDFWSTVMLMTGRFKGAPMEAHARIAEIDSVHFEHWLLLFRETVAEVCPPDAGRLFVVKSEVMARSLMHGIAVE